MLSRRVGRELNRPAAGARGVAGIRRAFARGIKFRICRHPANWGAGICLLAIWVATAPVSAGEARAAATAAPANRAAAVLGASVPAALPPAIFDVFQTADEQLAGRRVFTDFVRSHLDNFSAKRKAELAALKTPEQWQAAQASTRQRLSRIFGEFPQKTPLNARIAGKLEREAYTVEKVIFESQPGYHVTANLYLPKGRKFPLPGIVFPCGHSDEGKAYPPYQMSGSGFALKGYVVLVFDPMGQGERSEYWDPVTQKHLVGRGVSQHHAVRQPALLADWTLAGLRLWDGIRAVDYLESRAEVDRNKLAAVGCSGGGQMSWYLTAVDERIKVCAVSHPGGSCEDSNLLGLGEEGQYKYEFQSLVAPRPIRLIGGRDSGQVPVYQKSLDHLLPFYKGLGVDPKRAELVVVPGIHSMDQNNREAAYEWLNKWFGRESEGKPEGAIKPEKIEDLWCTEKGNTVASLGGETGQTLNARRADAIYRPEPDAARLKERVNRRIGLDVATHRAMPKSTSHGTVSLATLAIEKLSYESEPGIVIPALLLKPSAPKTDAPVYVFVSDQGKPRTAATDSLPFRLAQSGALVFALDVRGTGETGPLPVAGLARTEFTQIARAHDGAALLSAGFGRTTLGMRTLDVIRGIDFLAGKNLLQKRDVIVVGEGLGGLWAVTAAGADPRIRGAVACGTLPSYKLLTHARVYEVKGYFEVPGALRDYDIPDLVRLASPKPQLWLDSVNALGRPLEAAGAIRLLGIHQNFQVKTSANGDASEAARLIATIFSRTKI